MKTAKRIKRNTSTDLKRMALKNQLIDIATELYGPILADRLLNIMYCYEIGNEQFEIIIKC